MPNFKPKTAKKIKFNKKKITLDNTHKEKMYEFENIKNTIIPNYNKQIILLKKEFSTTNSFERKLQIKTEIKEIKFKKKAKKKEEQNYLLNNSKYIFNYFESKKKLSQGVCNKKKKILHNFFNKNYDNNSNKQNNEETNKNLNSYLKNVDSTFFNIDNYKKNYDVCNKCSGELIPIDNKGILVCKTCSIQIKYLIEHEKPSYKEPPKEVCFYAYKRINHFREILAQFQAKETTQIPEQVLIDIKNQIKKERIDLKTMNNKKAKDILKKLGYNKFYEHIPFIKDKLGIKPPVMKPELEDILCNLFLEIQKPYSKHCPNDRVNFLNYYYVLYKMCELLDEKSFLPYFPMLKDPLKRIEQDEIWKKICGELEWEFIPTV